MSFSINTNVASLQAQSYLRINQNFQNQTINEVTSGLRIVNSGDDAAGLAIANGYRSERAVLAQGINNANDGLSQLQIADGGLNNISQLLDRASTLATQSATGTFTGDRTVLNNEFQSVLGEINREAQAIGLNQGGTFAKSLSVFVGGGAGSTAAAQTTNGSVALDLSRSTVDTQSLGLNGFVAGYQVAPGAQDSGLYDIGSSSATSVAAIIAGTAATSTQFQLTGPGFSDANAISISVNLTSVGDTTGLASAINAAIQGAASTGTASAQALKSSDIVAQVHIGADGHQQLRFTSSSTAFEVTALDDTSNGLLGNLGTNTGGAFTGSTVTPEAHTLAAAAFVAGGTQQYSAAFTTLTHDATTPDAQTLTFTALDSNGVPQTAKVTIAASTTVDLTGAGAVAAINTALQATDNPALQNLIATTDPTNGTITFTSNSSSKFTISIGLEAGVDAGKGVANPNTVHTSALVGTGASATIADQASAQAAVTALQTAVETLGAAQGVVGRGENQFNYAVNLAQSQSTNLATAESSIRDADLAAEAANLTKAQILLQAGVAALAQANSAPQNVLSLLKG
jgi:flagellin-like hook-associated protein FlgL